MSWYFMSETPSVWFSMFAYSLSLSLLFSLLLSCLFIGNFPPRQFGLKVSDNAFLSSSPWHISLSLFLWSCKQLSFSYFCSGSFFLFCFIVFGFVCLFVFSLKVKMMPEISPKQVCKIVNVCLKWQIIPLYVHIWINYIYLVYND